MTEASCVVTGNVSCFKSKNLQIHRYMLASFLLFLVCLWKYNHNFSLSFSKHLRSKQLKTVSRPGNETQPTQKRCQMKGDRNEEWGSLVPCWREETPADGNQTAKQTSLLCLMSHLKWQVCCRVIGHGARWGQATRAWNKSYTQTRWNTSSSDVLGFGFSQNLQSEKRKKSTFQFNRNHK